MHNFDKESLKEILELEVGEKKPIDFAFADSSIDCKIGEEYQIGIDCYCEKCKEKKSFLIYKSIMMKEMYNFSERLNYAYSKSAREAAKEAKFKENFNNFFGHFEVEMNCAICDNKLIFYYIYQDGALEKIKTYPDLMNGLKDKYKKYSKLNSGRFNYYLELITGAYLYYNSGSGIGSYCYLRRCIENYVIDCLFDNCPKEEAEKYVKLIFPEKIKKAKEFIEDEIIELLKPLYSILSKGIHELDEEKCKGAFELLRETIEYILDDKLNNIEKEKKKKNLKKNLEKKSNELK